MKVRHKKSGQVTNIVTMTVGDGTYISSALPSDFEPVIEHPDGGGDYASPFETRLFAKLEEVLTAVNKQRGEPVEAQGEGVDGSYPKTLKDAVGRVGKLEDWIAMFAERNNNLETRVEEMDTNLAKLMNEHHALEKSNKEALSAINALKEWVKAIHSGINLYPNGLIRRIKCLEDRATKLELKQGLPQSPFGTLPITLGSAK